MRVLSILPWAVVLVAAATIGQQSIAQTTSATVTGTIADQDGAALPGAAVVLENLQTHLQSTVHANSEGFYRVSGLIPGTYQQTVSRQGFKSTVRDGIELHGQDQLALNYRLELGSVTESITIKSSEPLLQSESATVSTVIESAQIQNTPLNGRNVMNLSAFTPGVVPQGALPADSSTGRSQTFPTFPMRKQFLDECFVLRSQVAVAVCRGNR